MNGNAAFDTSARVAFASTSRAFGPAIDRPVSFAPSASMHHRTVLRQMRLEPAHMILLGNAGTGEEPALPVGIGAAEIGQREIADQPAVFFQHRRQRHAAGLWQLAGKQAVEPGRRALARHLVFGEVTRFPPGRHLSEPSSPHLRHARNRSSAATRIRPLTPSGAYHSGTSSPKATPHCAPFADKRS